MFLKLTKEDFSWSRAKKALPVFLLLWIGGILLGLLYLFSVRSHLQTNERDQVEKMLERVEALAAELGDAFVLGQFDAEERQILDEFLAHGRIVRAERARAEQAGEAPAAAA